MNQGHVGPHESRELELMKAGAKPLSMFVETIPPEFEAFPETEFDKLVAEGTCRKFVSLETESRTGGDVKIRRVLYALPGEEWRINAMLMVQDIYRPLQPGWRPDLERIIGHLLGYSSDDVEQFLAHVASQEPPSS